ncbi:MAG TPA: glycine C-acetyltransferase [Ktedonobacterales bacterium]|nr:glycine C-acetyltransferase [Ktedonobacterales bacterium]
MSLEHLKQRLGQELAALEQEGRYAHPGVLSGQQGPRITIQGKSYINLASNNYLGFAQDQQVIAAARNALDQYGFGLGGGRMLYSMPVLQELEKRLAAFKQREAAIVCQTGYDTNLTVLSTLVGEGDVIISDGANHASIVDGIRLSRAERRIYPHNDMGGLEEQLRASQGARTVLIVTDGVFSMDGDLAPLPDIVTLAERYGALVYVDDAHGDGVLGKRGSGIVEHFGLHGRVAIEMGTLSKALGGMGGFVAADQEIVNYLFQRGRSFIFSTGHQPPMVAAGLLAALDLLAAQPERLERLWDNTRFFRSGLQQLGLSTGVSVTPIVPIMFGDESIAVQFSQEIRAAGIYAQAFTYPVVPQGKARIRCIVSAAHSQEELATALDVCKATGQKLRLI